MTTPEEKENPETDPKAILVVWLRQASVAPPPLRQLPSPVPQIKDVWESVRKACEWKHPRALNIRLLF